MSYEEVTTFIHTLLPQLTASDLPQNLDSYSLPKGYEQLIKQRLVEERLVKEKVGNYVIRTSEGLRIAHSADGYLGHLKQKQQEQDDPRITNRTTRRTARVGAGTGIFSLVISVFALWVAYQEYHKSDDTDDKIVTLQDDLRAANQRIDSLTRQAQSKSQPPVRKLLPSGAHSKPTTPKSLPARAQHP